MDENTMYIYVSEGFKEKFADSFNGYMEANGIISRSEDRLTVDEIGTDMDVSYRFNYAGLISFLGFVWTFAINYPDSCIQIWYSYEDDKSDYEYNEVVKYEDHTLTIIEESIGEDDYYKYLLDAFPEERFKEIFKISNWKPDYSYEKIISYFGANCYGDSDYLDDVTYEDFMELVEEYGIITTVTEEDFKESIPSQLQKMEVCNTMYNGDWKNAMREKNKEITVYKLFDGKFVEYKE